MVAFDALYSCYFPFSNFRTNVHFVTPPSFVTPPPSRANRYKDAQALCESVYRQGAYRTDNLLLLGAVHFQLRNFSECILYNQVRSRRWSLILFFASLVRTGGGANTGMFPR